MKPTLFCWMTVVVPALAIMAGCAEFVQVGTAVGQQMGAVSPEDKERFDRMARETAKAARPMTDPEEYFVGRAA